MKQFRPPHSPLRCKDKKEKRKTQRQQVWHIRGKGELLLEVDRGSSVVMRKEGKVVVVGKEKKK